MTNQLKKNQKSTVSPVAAGIAGVVAGGVAVAAAVALSDKKNRKKVYAALGDAKEKVSGYVDTLKSQPLVKNATNKINEVVKDLT